MSILTMHHGLMAGIKQGDPPGYVTIGGRLYRTVTIGTQTWLAENLDYKASGITIAAGGVPTTPAAWYYNNDEDTYGQGGSRECGLLYNWYAAKFLNDNRATLFPGWHVPSRTEWQTLYTAVGGIAIAGKKLKSSALSWSAFGWEGEDTYGFTILPGGFRDFNGNFGAVTNEGYFWTLTDGADSSPNKAFYERGRDGYDSMEDWRYGISKTQGHSVRLVKDA